MRRFKIAGLLVLGLLLLVPSIQAQFLGQLSTARTLPVGKYDLGGYFGVYDDAFAFFGQFRGGVSEYFDLGMKLGVINLNPHYDDPYIGENSSGMTLNGDLKYQLLDVSLNDPFDLSIGAGMEFSSVTDYSIFSFGANFIGSRDFELKKGRAISPYGRLNLRGERKHKGSPQWEANKVGTKNYFQAGLNLGVSLKTTRDLRILGELQFDENFGFIGGVTYSFY
jgi:hypothetical protein